MRYKTKIIIKNRSNGISQKEHFLVPSDWIPVHEITARISELSCGSNWHTSPLLAYFSVKGHGVPYLMVHNFSPRQYVGACLKILVTNQHVAINFFSSQVLAFFLSFMHTHT